MNLFKIRTSTEDALKQRSWWIGTTISILAVIGLYYAAKHNVNPLSFLENNSKKDNGSNDVEKD